MKGKTAQLPPKAYAKSEEDGIWNDPRFSHLVSDPRFKNIHKSTKTIKIDKRFKSMFSDDKFNVKYTVDKYGRRVNKSSTDDLEKYYDLSSEDEDEEKRKEEAELVKEGGDINVKLETDQELSEGVKLKLQDLNIDYARGEVPLLSDSSSDDESSDDENEKELFIEHVWGELDNEAPRTEESTKRLAACNMDWDRIRASDIMVLCNSFLPPGGSILRVTIYPSEFGKERMAKEEVKGPQELTENIQNRAANDNSSESDNDDFTDSDAENENENEEGNDYHMEKLRQYQLNRLKYYYAVIECNSVSTADKLYAECDGLEYESTATKFDLRFIPDEMQFDDQPKDECTETPDFSKYKPRLFTTTALQQAKVELTWDENDVDRRELNEKMLTGKLNEIPDAELRKYVAYSSEEDDDGDANSDKETITDNDSKTSVTDNVPESTENLRSKLNKKKNIKSAFTGERKEDVISKYKNLLNDITVKEEEKKNNRVEMEFSWGIGVKSGTKSEKQKSIRQTDELTPFEKLIEKKREKKRERKVEIRKLKKAAKLNSDDDNDDDDSDIDNGDLPDGVDLNDPYFAEEFANGDFEVPKSKKNKKKKSDSNKPVANDSSDDDKKESELALMLEDDDNKAHFSLKKIQENENESKSKKRRKQLKQRKFTEKNEIKDNFQINVSDDRFAAVFSSHQYNIDPTDSHFKKTKGMELLIQEKLKRKPVETIVNSEPSEKKAKRNVADGLLVKSIKRKVQQNQR